MTKPNDDRRSFLKKTVIAGTAATIPYHFSATKTVASETQSKSDALPIGLIGAGGMGVGNMKSAKSKNLVDVVASLAVAKPTLTRITKKFLNATTSRSSTSLRRTIGTPSR